MREEIPKLLGGERLDRIVSMLGDISRTRASALIEQSQVHVDGVVNTVRSTRVSAGVNVEFPDQENEPAEAPQAEGELAITLVSVDDDVIVVDKPAGVVVHPGAGNPDGTLVNALLAKFPEMANVGDPARPGIVQRLDKGTSGLLAIGRSQAGFDGLVEQLSARTVARAYDTVVWGIPDSTAGVIDAPIGRSQRERTRMAVAADGRQARTRYEVLASYEKPEPVSRLLCRLETGRTHQIRVHLQAIGHPIIGDRRYGGARVPFRLGRPFLHATHLGFIHPVTGEAMAFDSPPPADLLAVLAKLEGLAGL